MIEFAAKTPDGSVKLANLQISANSVSFDTNNDRQYSGISLPNSNSKTLTLRSGGNRNPNLAVLTGSLKIDGTLTVKDSLTIEGGQINIDGNQQIVFTNGGTTDQLKLQLWEGYGLGINDNTLFYTAYGNHSWRDNQNNERMLLTTTSGGGLTVKGTGTSSFASDLLVNGKNVYLPGHIYLREYDSNIAYLQARDDDKKQDISLQLRTQKKDGDSRAVIEAMMITPDGNVGIGINDPGNFKLNVQGSQYLKGSLNIDATLTVTGTGTSSFAGNLKVEGNTQLSQEAWQTATFGRGWDNFGDGYNEAGYFKDSLGIVHLKGLVKNGINTTWPIFILPKGYQPSAREMHTIKTSENDVGRVDIVTDGRILLIEAPDASWVSLDGITFRAAG
ncbi:MAG: hypothetical protein QNJ51_26720 [Calothrix sp. MO_167.B12]|nr:hypothetical protein [Calothrix sp. MO_167.B12]